MDSILKRDFGQLIGCHWLIRFALGVTFLAGSLLFTQPGFAQSSHDEYRLAMEFYQRGEFEGAKSTFHSILRNYPNSPQALLTKFYLGETLIELQDHDLAYQAYQGFLTDSKEHEFIPRATFRLGECAYFLGRDSQAIRLFEEFGIKYPAHELNRISLPYLGKLRLKNAEPQLAARVFQASLNVHPDGPLATESRFGLAQALMKLKRVDEAIPHFEILTNATDQTIKTNSLVTLGQIELSRQNYRQSKIRLQSALVQKPAIKVGLIRYYFGRVLMAEQQLEQALEQFDLACSAGFEDSTIEANTYRDAVFVAQNLENDDAALKYWRLARSRFPNQPLAADAYAAEIEYAYQNNLLESGLQLSKEFVERFPTHEQRVRVLETRGRLLYQNQNYVESNQVFLDLLANHSDPVSQTMVDNWKYLLAIGQVGTKDLVNAANTLESVNLSTCSEDLAPKVALVLASTLESLSRYQDSIQVYRKFLSFPSDVPNENAGRIHQSICRMLAKERGWNEAQRAFAEFRTELPDATELIETADQLAARAFQQQEYEHASIWYDFVADHSQTDKQVSEALAGLGWCQLKMGDAASAQHPFMQLLKRFPNSAQAKNAAIARAKYLDDSREFELAAQTYQLITERYPDDKFVSSAMLRQAIMLKSTSKKSNWRKALALLVDYVQLPKEPDHVDEALYHLAGIYRKLGQQKKAIEKYRQLTLRHLGSRFWADSAFRVAFEHSQQKEYDVAEKIAFQILTSSNVSNDILEKSILLYGDVTTQSEKWELLSTRMQAILDKEETVAQLNRRLISQVKYWVAESAYQKHEYPEATKIFESLVNDQELNAKLKPWVGLRLTEIAFKEKNLDAANRLANRFLKQFPNFQAKYEFNFIRGIVMSRQANLESAKIAFQAVANDPVANQLEAAAIAQWRVGETLFHQEKYIEAIRAFEKVVTQHNFPKWKAAALIQAGKCQEKLGNWEQAAQLYQRLVTQYPTSRYRRDAEQRLNHVRSAQLERPTATIKK